VEKRAIRLINPDEKMATSRLSKLAASIMASKKSAVAV